MTTITLRPRRPLEALPLSRYTALPLPPSPVSLPNKRSLPSSPGRPAEASSSKLRKVSGDEGGQETIRRKKSEITPRAKKALAEDEMGMGRSPARRLFTDEGQSFGISGAVLPPSPGGPSRTLDYSDSSSNIPGPSRTLAPSPPISTLPSPVEHENGATIDPHDIGFKIHPDSPVSRSVLGTPDSRPNRQSHRPTRAAPPSPSAPAAPLLQHNDQENIPPPRTTPSSTRSTPSKSSTSSARFYDDNDIVNLTGSGRKRVRERSKLNNEVHTAVGEDDELTPGRTKGVNKGKGKQRMAEEVDDA